MHKGGRPKGSQNKKGHKAGGARQGSGPKPKPADPSQLRINAFFGHGTAVEEAGAPIGDAVQAGDNEVEIDASEEKEDAAAAHEHGEQSEDEPQWRQDVHEVDDLVREERATRLPEDWDSDEEEGEEGDGDAGEEDGAAADGRPSYQKAHLSNMRNGLAREMESSGYAKDVRNGNLWRHPPEPSLTQRTHSPESYCLMPVFLWELKSMEPVGAKLVCPRCTGNSLESKGWTNGRRVVASSHSYYILTRRMKCLDCADRRQASRDEAKARRDPTHRQHEQSIVCSQI